MSTDEFARLLKHFEDRPLPATSARHVYLWCQELSLLQSILPAGLAVTLDSYALAADLPRQPYAVDEARRLLQAAIRRWLDDRIARVTTQQLIIVTGTSLLVRYRIPFTDFFQTANDLCIIVFVLSPMESSFQPSRPLPAYIQFRPESNLEYLQAMLGPTSIVGATAK